LFSDLDCLVEASAVLKRGAEIRISADEIRAERDRMAIGERGVCEIPARLQKYAEVVACFGMPRIQDENCPVQSLGLGDLVSLVVAHRLDEDLSRN
jgi:hypothetical protein